MWSFALVLVAVVVSGFSWKGHTVWSALPRAPASKRRIMPEAAGVVGSRFLLAHESVEVIQRRPRHERQAQQCPEHLVLHQLTSGHSPLSHLDPIGALLFVANVVDDRRPPLKRNVPNTVPLAQNGTQT